MTLKEIAPIVISLLALIVSSLTAYLTLLARFQGYILPRHRAVLTQIKGIPCLVLECEFVNLGAKPGAIEDLLVNAFDEQGNRVIFTPFLTTDKFNVFQNYESNDFSIFSGISLGVKERREIFVVFRPSQTDFKPSEGIMYLQINMCVNISRKNWEKSQIKFSLDLKTENIQEWISPSGKPQQISAVEISQSRRAFLQKNQK
jgi:hypothetical protein